MKTSDDQSVSIIICVYTLDRWDDIGEAVASVYSLNVPPLEIIIVVDHNEELRRRLKFVYPDLRIVENAEQRGLSGSRNTGIAIARGRYIAFVDDDATVDGNWLSMLTRHFVNEDVLGSVSYVEPHWVGTRPRWFPQEFLWTVGCSHFPKGNAPVEVRNLFGGAMCLRRDLFKKVGGFNSQLGRTGSKLPISGEETELCMRANRDIGRCIFIHEPGAVMYHKVPAKRLTWKYFVLRCFAEGVSKARIAGMPSSSGTLASEWDYVLRILPAAFSRSMGDLVRRRDISGGARCTALMLGFLSTLGGFSFGKLAKLADRIRASSEHSSLSLRQPTVLKDSTPGDRA